MNISRLTKLIGWGLVAYLFLTLSCLHKKSTRDLGYEYITDDHPINKALEQNKQQTNEEEKKAPSANVEYGKASYYSDKFQGRPTASGEPYDRNKLTAAHPKYPFGTICRVTNMANGKSVEVRVNDRGPHTKARVIDLSYQAMSLLDGLSAGIIEVKVEFIK